MVAGAAFGVGDRVVVGGGLDMGCGRGCLGGKVAVVGGVVFAAYTAAGDSGSIRQLEGGEVAPGQD